MPQISFHVYYFFPLWLNVKESDIMLTSSDKANQQGFDFIQNEITC